MESQFENEIQILSQSDEPAIRLGMVCGLLTDSQTTTDRRTLQGLIRQSPRVVKLLAGRNADGIFPWHPYKKWQGAHWVLTMLAELNFPPNDTTLIPLSDQEMDWLEGKQRQKWIDERTKKAGGHPIRVCASMEGNALLAFLKLGLALDKVEYLADSLMKWQWPDGGWNCDASPAASHSSFMESLIPMRALFWYGKLSGSSRSLQAAERAASVFIKRKLFKKQKDDTVIDSHFLELHYPCYWHYDILFALKVLKDMDRLDDPGCADAINMLRQKRLCQGGWPAEGKYYHNNEKISGYSPVDWGACGKRRMNPWVTLEALRVLNG